jgi:hypothetical protein
VTHTADIGANSLRWAIDQANSTSGADMQQGFGRWRQRQLLGDGRQCQRWWPTTHWLPAKSRAVPTRRASRSPPQSSTMPLDESHETLIVSLSAPGGGTTLASPATHTLTPMPPGD